MLPAISGHFVDESVISLVSVVDLISLYCQKNQTGNSSEEEENSSEIALDAEEQDVEISKAAEMPENTEVISDRLELLIPNVLDSAEATNAAADAAITGIAVATVAAAAAAAPRWNSSPFFRCTCNEKCGDANGLGNFA